MTEIIIINPDESLEEKIKKYCDDNNACREKSKDSTVNRESVIIYDEDR